MKKSFLFILVIIVIQLSCKENVITPPDNKPSGWQEEIPWLSLADSPWPKHRHDPQNTGRSIYTGPTAGVLSWEIDSLYLLSELVLSGSNNLLVNTAKGTLFNFDQESVLNWKSEYSMINTPHITTTPMLTSEGNIIVADNSRVYSIKENGVMNWNFLADHSIFITGMNIDIEGNIYFIDATGMLYSLNKDGSLNWKYSDTRFYNCEESGIAFSPDGKTLYIPGFMVSIFAFDINSKSIKWNIDVGKVRSSPMIDAQGNIYIIVSPSEQDTLTFCSFSSSGVERFKYFFTSEWGNYWRIDPTIDKNGNLFFAGDTLYSLNYNGDLRWKTDLPGFNYSPLVNDKNGSIYLITQSNTSPNHMLLSVNNDGYLNWSTPLNLSGAGLPGYSNIIGSDNSLYMNILNINQNVHDGIAISKFK